jgi:hypothetical protein
LKTRTVLSEETSHLIDFEKVDVLPGIASGFWFLIVRQNPSSANVTVHLVPRRHETRPDYWQYELVGCTSGENIPSTAQAIVSPLFRELIGTKGIEIVGATRKERKEFVLSEHAMKPAAGRAEMMDVSFSALSASITIEIAI